MKDFLDSGTDLRLNDLIVQERLKKAGMTETMNRLLKAIGKPPMKRLRYRNANEREVVRLLLSSMSAEDRRIRGLSDKDE